jgi:hypothetical protein
MQLINMIKVKNETYPASRPTLSYNSSSGGICFGKFTETSRGTYGCKIELPCTSLGKFIFIWSLL